MDFVAFSEDATLYLKNWYPVFSSVFFVETLNLSSDING